VDGLQAKVVQSALKLMNAVAHASIVTGRFAQITGASGGFSAF
jgi:hypothetical protein